MNVSQSFKMALKSLRASKLRSLLTMLGIIIGVAAVIVILSLGNGVTGMVNQQVEKLGVNLVQTTIYGVGDGTTMLVDPQSMYDLVEEHPDLLSGVSPYLTAPAVVRSGGREYEGTTVYGVSEAIYRPETNSTLDGCALAAGRFLQYVDVARLQNVCVLGAYLAQDAFQGDALGRSLSIGGREFTVVGVLEPLTQSPSEDSLDNQVYLPYENAMELAGTRQVSLYLFTSTSGATAAAAKELIDGALFDFFQNQDAYFTTTMAEQAELIDSIVAYWDEQQ